LSGSCGGFLRYGNRALAELDRELARICESIVNQAIGDAERHAVT
jgi:hypothetical protein